MKRYKISKELKKYLRRVFVLGKLKWEVQKDENGQWWCITNISSNHFHRLVQRAKCEKATEETGVLHITYKESLNPAFATYLMHQVGTTSYCVIDAKAK